MFEQSQKFLLREYRGLKSLPANWQRWPRVQRMYKEIQGRNEQLLRELNRWMERNA